MAASDGKQQQIYFLTECTDESLTRYDEWYIQVTYTCVDVILTDNDNDDDNDNEEKDGGEYEVKRTEIKKFRVPVYVTPEVLMGVKDPQLNLVADDIEGLFDQIPCPGKCDAFTFEAQIVENNWLSCKNWLFERRRNYMIRKNNKLAKAE